MKVTNQITIPAVTIGHTDLEHLVTRLVEYFKNTKIKNLKSKVSFSGKNYKEEFQYNDFPDFLNFKEGLNMIDITISADDLDILIVLSSKERNPFTPIYTKAIVESSDRILTNGLSEEIVSFFKKRKNYHQIVHGYGIWVSMLASILIYSVVADIFSTQIIKYNFDRKLLLCSFLILSFPIKSYLRWLFPYVYFLSENRQRRFQRLFIYAIIMSLIGRFIFLLIEKDLKSVIGL